MSLIHSRFEEVFILHLFQLIVPLQQQRKQKYCNRQLLAHVTTKYLKKRGFFVQINAKKINNLLTKPYKMNLNITALNFEYYFTWTANKTTLNKKKNWTSLLTFYMGVFGVTSCHRLLQTCYKFVFYSYFAEIFLRTAPLSNSETPIYKLIVNNPYYRINLALSEYTFEFSFWFFYFSTFDFCRVVSEKFKFFDTETISAK